MEPIKNFSIFKVKDHNGDPKKPTHSISTKIGDKYEYIGKCWTKESNGGKFLSCSLDKPYNDKPGYSIEKDPSEIDVEVHTKSTMTSVQPDGSDPINLEDVPF